MSKDSKKSKSPGLFSLIFGSETKKLPKAKKKRKPKSKTVKTAPTHPELTQPQKEVIPAAKSIEEFLESKSIVQKPLESWEIRRKEDVAYTAKPLILIGFPMTKPKHRNDAKHLIYLRRNGNFSIEIHGHAEYGLPFGQDELLLIAIIDQALKTDSPKVEITSIYKVLKDFGMPVGGSKYKLVQQSIFRIFTSNITYWFQNEFGVAAKKSYYFSAANFEFLKDKYDYDPKQNDFVVLSDDLWTELKKNPIPFDLAVLRKLKSSPGATRLYLWAAPRLFRIPKNKGFIYVPLSEFSQEIGSNESNPRKLKFNLETSWLPKLNQALIETGSKEIPIRIVDNTLILGQANLVPKQLKSKPDLQITKQSKSSQNKKVAPTQTQREFDIDWVLEKEVHEFVIGLRTSLSQQANQYRILKKTIYKGQYEDETDLFPGEVVS